MNWTVPRIWEGGDAWIIGGGPSLTEQFNIPKDVVTAVMEHQSLPSAYSPYLEPIHNKHTIAVNASFLLGDWVSMIFYGDTGFYLRYQKELSEHPALKVSCEPHQGKQSWIKYLQKDKSHPFGISSFPNKVSWNGNSGAAAVSLAVHLGVKRVILLGFDMKISSDNYQHWHNAYNRGKIIEQNRLKKMPFDRFIISFKKVAIDAQKMGIEILNASPNSALTMFPKFSVKDLL